MKSEEPKKTAAVAVAYMVSTVGSPDELAAIGMPIGTFAGTADVILRIRNGIPVPANTGAQGGGQN
jgi:hypothetical protein